eukprot:5396629-Amphidinium_carterae.1
MEIRRDPNWANPKMIARCLQHPKHERRTKCSPSRYKPSSDPSSVGKGAMVGGVALQELHLRRHGRHHRTGKALRSRD